MNVNNSNLNYFHDLSLMIFQFMKSVLSGYGTRLLVKEHYYMKAYLFKRKCISKGPK